VHHIERPLAAGQWTAAQAQEWAAERPWLCGFNFLPSSAVNFLEMWRGDTFDPATIDRELGWAAAIGFNALRTNLHYLDWLHDPVGLIARVDHFLALAAKHGLECMICLFDDCEFSGENPQWSNQSEPRPGVHNGPRDRKPRPAAGGGPHRLVEAPELRPERDHGLRARSAHLDMGPVQRAGQPDDP
jgi:hypothetical protein